MAKYKRSKCSKFGLVLWKDWLIVKSHKCALFCQFLVPVLCILFIILIAKNINKQEDTGNITKDTETIFFPMRIRTVGDAVWKKLFSGPSNRHLAYSPKSKVLDEFVAEASRAVGCIGSEGFVNKAALTAALMSTPYFGGVAFSEDDSYESGLPKKLQYSIRMPAVLRTVPEGDGDLKTWMTDQTYPTGGLTALPRNRSAHDGGTPPGYNVEGFLPLQNSIAYHFLREHSKQTKEMPEYIMLHRFPHPPFKSNELHETVRTLVPVFVALVFYKVVVSMVQAIVTERERRLTEAMRIMGLPGWMPLVGHLVHYAFVSLLICLIVSILLSAAEIFVYAKFFVLFVMLFAFAVWSLCFGLLMSTVSQSSNVCVFVAQVGMLLLIAGTCLIKYKYWASGLQVIFVLLLGLPGIMLGCGVLMELESQGSDAILTTAGTEVKVAAIVLALLMIISGLLYALLALYIQQVRPGAYGVARPWNFPCTGAFWCGKGEADKRQRPQSPQQRPSGASADFSANFEPKTSAKSAVAGISMRGLYKQYRNGTVGLRPFDLEMYEHEITVLLGHNGAGKTTTMSILTGMIEPTDGTALVNGYDIRTQMLLVRGSMGYCPQHDILFDDLTVVQHIRFYAGIKGVNKEDSKQEVERYVSLMQVEKKRDARSATLSGGQKRTLSVCIAFCGGSHVILCDEPSSGMDPSARRNLWRIIELEKRGRTVLLSTHFMDEADVLGDRIAIMNQGALKALGSPFYLKKHFGIGYHLNCSVSPDTDRNKLTKMLSGHIAEVRLDRDTGTEVSYTLPDNRATSFPKMLAELEDNLVGYKVYSYGISLGSMEEVFLLIGSDTEAGEPQRQPVRPFRFLTGCALNCSQLCALLRKKRLTAFYNWPVTFGQLLLPAIIVLIIGLCSLGAPSSNDLPELKLTTLPDEPQVVLNNAAGNAVKKYVDAYDAVTKELGAKVLRTDDMNAAILKLWKDDFALVSRHIHIGASFPKADTAEAWFHNQPYHAAPLALATLHDAIMRAQLGTGYSIDVRNEPQPFTEAQKANGNRDSIGQNWAVSIAMAMTLVMAMYVLPVVRERSNGANRLQFISGAKVWIYWTAYFMWDYAVFILCVLLTFTIMVCFRKIGYSTGTDFVRFMLVLLVFGFCALHLTYLLARCYTVQAKAFSALTMLYFFSFFLAYMCKTMVSKQSDSVRNAVEILLLVVPHYAMLIGISNMYTSANHKRTCEDMCYSIPGCKSPCSMTPACCDDGVWKMDGDGLLAPIVLMAATGAFYCLLNLAIDKDCFAGCCTGGSGQNNSRAGKAAAAAAAADADADVVAEEQRVAKMGTARIREHALVARALHKQFKQFVAVHQLSLAVGGTECFGLLGVNGAGKTTTFGMLTGTQSIGGGEAWISGYSLKTRRQRANQLIGYTPQFDALIEEQTGRETLHMFCRLRGVPAEHVQAQTKRLAAELSVGRHLDKRVRECSGGNKRKISTAVAMIGRPVLVFLDEPTTGMDPGARHSLWVAVQRVRTGGTAVVLTSHSMDECEALCTRLAIMVNGRFQCIGSVQHLKSKFGGGCTLVVKLKREAMMSTEGTEAEVKRITAYVQEQNKGATLEKQYLGLVTFAIPSDGQPVKFSKMFKRMLKAQSQFAIETFTLSQTSLEEVFLQFAEKQHTK